jgi:hypothetical protein
MTEHRASCQCGAVRVSSQNDPDFTLVCNCVACQKKTGAAFGGGAFFKLKDVQFSGDAWKYTREADTGRELTNHFCPNCGTTLYWTLEMRPDHVGVASGCFDTKAPRPFRVIWADVKHDWVEFPDDMEVLGGASPEPK